MLALFSIILAVVPTVGFLLLIWVMDRYEREPLGLVIKHFLWGAFGAIFFGIIGSQMFSGLISTLVSGAEGREFADSIVVAPFVEEIAKGIFLVLFTIRRPDFDGVTDGFVYGAAIGLGFGMTENFIYFLSAETVEAWLMLVFIRTFFSAVMHSMATGTLGAFVGFAKFTPAATRWLFILLGLGIAMFVHFVWNLAVSFKETTLLGLLFIILGLMVISAVLQIALFLEGRMIRTELTEETRSGLIPMEHLSYIPYTSRRKMIGW
jgi:RsiW-degrading membrane proteinase PrsW (M82 family)